METEAHVGEGSGQADARALWPSHVTPEAAIAEEGTGYKPPSGSSGTGTQGVWSEHLSPEEEVWCPESWEAPRHRHPPAAMH